MTVVVRRSALRMWLLAMAGIPMLVISLDVLTRRNITDWLRELIFRPEDTQIYEPRDVIWAWVMLLFGAFIVLWGLKELFMPTRVVECRVFGLALKVGGPFREPHVVPWKDIDDVVATEVVDDGERLPALMLRLVDRGNLPDHPWGARWMGKGDLVLLSQDWSEKPETVAGQIIECAVQMARKEARARVEYLSESMGEEE